MAHSNNSIITGKLQGSIGKELVFREWEGKTVVAKSPKARKGGPSIEQAELQEKFLFASRYAKAITDAVDQTLALAYATALRPRQNVYSRALEDFLSPPIVKMIDARRYKGAIGDVVVARAIDDFRITGVLVEIYTPDGVLLEAGNATQNMNGIEWTYTAKETNTAPAGLTGCKIKVIAFDVPGNEGILEVTL